ncbi:hypothetical protein NLJ89_g9141 [Agrocybe chaxingu]|uniref:Uncharacterized protein n=1 Tax=Agrocybe chaxingu TaxID=84603 RepID=A0A9W8JRC5_9AGAR|nr:hypothetical protein NLJ89_g9141 [Agrocybe chaxingu]
MDIYLRASGVEAMGCWLIRNGYRYKFHSRLYSDIHFRSDALALTAKCVKGSSSFENPLLAVYNFTEKWRHVDNNRLARCVQLIVVDVDPISYVLHEFHSTVVMNFITPTSAVCVFPRATLVDRRSFVTKIRPQHKEEWQRWLQKYRSRGFSVVEDAVDVESVLLGSRYIGDSHTFVVYFQDMPPTRSIYGNHGLVYRFDVLDRSSGVVADGACLRVAEPYIWTLLSKYYGY